MNKKLTLLIGLPACGKSTLRANMEVGNNLVLSTDDLIEARAAARGQTYNEAFPDVIDQCTHLFNQTFLGAIKHGAPHLIIDRTNLGKKSRRGLLVPALQHGYEAHAIVFVRPYTNDEHIEWERRLNSRPGKNIPNATLVDMFCNYHPPMLDEGFKTVSLINTFR